MLTTCDAKRAGLWITEDCPFHLRLIMQTSIDCLRRVIRLDVLGYQLTKNVEEVDASIENRIKLLPRESLWEPSITFRKTEPIVPNDIVCMRIPIPDVRVKRVSKDLRKLVKSEIFCMPRQIFENFVGIRCNPVSRKFVFLN